MCVTSADCGNGGSCIFDNSGHAVCQLAAEKNRQCNTQNDCPSPLACAADYRCRNLCSTDSDCNVLGISGRVCAADKNGVRYCADPPETSGGSINSTPACKSNCIPVVEPTDAGGVAGMGAGGAGGQGGAGARDAGSSDAAAGAGGGSAGASGNGGKGGGAGQGGAGGSSVQCLETCTQGHTCVNGTCAPCGMASQACCDGQSCGANLSCSTSNVCTCGGSNQACCGGSSCSSGFSCDKSTVATGVCACGAVGLACCAGTGGGAPTCSGNATCAGVKCSCVAEIVAGSNHYSSIVLRYTDGTVWQWCQETAPTGTPFSQVKNPSGIPLVASAVAVATKADRTHIGCAVQASDGSVWCFPDSSLADSTFLGAGLGPTDATSGAVQVLTAVGGPVLTGVTQIDGGGDDNVSGAVTFCAVTGGGTIYCWGYGGVGQLGRGDRLNSSFARKVMADASTVFANAVEVRVGFETTCARKSDGSVWCWGTNTYGELGVTTSTMASSYYPVQIAFTGTTPQRTATRLTSGSYITHCAIMQDTTVVCWGSDQFGETGAPPPATPFEVGPTTVLVSAGGPAYTNVIDLAGSYGSIRSSDPIESICARTQDLDIVCWGNGNPYPTPYVNDGSGTPVSDVRIPLAGSPNYLNYIDSNGDLYIAGGLDFALGSLPNCTAQ